MIWAFGATEHQEPLLEWVFFRPKLFSAFQPKLQSTFSFCLSLYSYRKGVRRERKISAALEKCTNVIFLGTFPTFPFELHQPKNQIQPQPTFEGFHGLLCDYVAACKAGSDLGMGDWVAWMSIISTYWRSLWKCTQKFRNRSKGGRAVAQFNSRHLLLVLGEGEVKAQSWGACAKLRRPDWPGWAEGVIRYKGSCQC